MDNRFIKNYNDFANKLPNSTDINQFQLRIGKAVTMVDGRSGTITGVCSTPDKVKVRINESGKVEEVKICDFS